MNTNLVLSLLIVCYQFHYHSLLKFDSEFFDNADIICSKEMSVTKTVFESWFDDKLKMVPVDDQLLKDYTKCWMIHRELINDAGDINWDNVKKWIENDVYAYFDKHKYSIERKIAKANEIVPKCKKLLGINDNIGNKWILLYNCLVAEIKDS